jgi:predicted glycosyltransferase
MKKVLGIFRGFPGLGRVVVGVSLLETLRDKYDCDVRFISYLQGNKYFESHGYVDLQDATPMDYCSIGLLPTNKMGAYIHNTIKEFMPDVIIIDGEPLILQSIKISHPNQKIVALLNPADLENPNNDKEAMEFFNAMYSLSDLAIVHGLRIVKRDKNYNNFISINTIIRQEIIAIKNAPTNSIYCVLGGGTVNVEQQFEDSTLKIGQLCQKVATLLPKHTMHIICSSQNIFNALNENNNSTNVLLYEDIISAEKYYRDACLVITRSGRNTLSELAYLGIPAISFISGCAYRKIEQTNNINDLRTSAIASASLEITPEKFAELCVKMIGTTTDHLLQCGNDEALKYILQL